MTVSFGRSKFKLDCDLVSIALKSCIGGLCDVLSIVQLSERSFRFSINSRAVGFMVYDLKSFSCDAFKCYFHLWGNGGPSWKREFADWQRECMEEWTLISPNKKRSMNAMAALQKRPSKPSLKKSNFNYAKRHLNFATFFSYPACHVYEYPASNEEVATALEAGYSCPQVIRCSKLVILPDSLSKISTGHVVLFGSIASPRAATGNSKSTVSALTDFQFPLSSPDLIGPAQDEDSVRMIEETADHFWRCDRCLSLSHDTPECTGKFCCKGCFRYGHVKKDCWRAKSSLHWVIKTSNQADSIGLCATRSNSTRGAPPPLTLTGISDLATVSPPPSCSASMANFPVDPHRFAPAGFDVLEPWGADAHPARLFLTATAPPPRRHESWALAQVDPRPEGDDIDHVLN
jgi:hypothetical protein